MNNVDKIAAIQATLERMAAKLDKDDVDESVDSNLREDFLALRCRVDLYLSEIARLDKPREDFERLVEEERSSMKSQTVTASEADTVEF